MRAMARLASLALAAMLAVERVGWRARLWSALAAGGGLFALALAGGWCRPDGVRLVTFNIESFQRERTDLARLTELFGHADADVLAVQEIVDPDGFAVLVERLAVGGRHYRSALSQCGGKSKMHVGFVWDSRRIELVERREYPELDPDGGGSCSAGERPGLLGRFSMGGAPLELLVVHLASGGAEDRARKRQTQWDRALAIVARRRADGVEAIGVLGDANSTGYLDDRWGERSWLNDRLSRAGLRMATSDVGCSEYWPPGDGSLSPSLLDHVVLTPAFPASPTARVIGYCAEARCRRLDERNPPRDYTSVSDHCPVVVGQ